MFSINKIVRFALNFVFIQVVVIVAIVGIVAALPAPQAPGGVPILTRSEIRDDFNQYSLSYSSANGIAGS